MRDWLDYLVRNVHAWPKNTPYVLLAGDEHFEFGAVFCEEHVRIGSELPDGVVVYKQQWLDRRAELQNKPGWGNAPAGAQYLAQECNGEWGFWTNKPNSRCSQWVGDEPLADYNTANAEKFRGEVLGDWKDTLEKRPVANRALVVMGEEETPVAEFEPFTSVEDAPPAGNCRCVSKPLHTIHHAAFLHQDCQLLLSEPELVVFRTADGELIHCKPKECLIDPDVYGLAARLLADMSGYPVAPEHTREVAEQMNWRVE